MHTPKPTCDNATAARYIGIQPKTLETWRSTGRVIIPYLKIGKLVRYEYETLDQYKASCRVGDDAPTAEEV